jgi:hypothetical protein
VRINCPIRVQGNAVFAANTNLNMNFCGRITATGFNAPDGVGIQLDMNGNTAQQGSKFVFATFQSSQGFINRLNVINIAGASAAPGLNPRLGDGEGAIHFRAPGDNDMRTGNGNINEPVGPPPDPNFDSNGNRVNRCNALTCRDENACGRPTPEATCDQNSGAWVLPGNFDLRTADISCPLTIRGDLRVTDSLTVRGCARITVEGTATLGNENVNNDNFASNGITASFDLNDLGAVAPGSRIWLSANRMIGGVRSWQMSNIWPRSQGPSVRPTNQKCGGLMSWQFTPSGETPPPDNCLSAPARATADENLGDQAFMVEENAAAVGEGVFIDESAAAFATFDESAAAVDNFETVAAVENVDTAAAVAPVDENVAVVNAIDETAFATIEETVPVLENVDQAAFAQDETALAVDDVILTDPQADLAQADTANTNTNSNTASTGAPAYAYVLFALAVVVLAAIVVVQVLIIKVKRAQDDVRV